MRKLIPIIFLTLLITTACKESYDSKPVRFNGLNEKSIEIIDTVKFEGFIIGASFNRNEVYIQSISVRKGQYSLIIVDLETKKIKKGIQLKSGNFEAPKEFFNPSFMQFVGGNYIIVDQFHKILVYDENFKYLYTDMFYNLRFFIDFFVYENQKFFVIGIKLNSVKFFKNDIQIFRFPGNARPGHYKDLHVFTNESIRLKNRQNRKFMHCGSIWPSGKGFQKDGKIYYANYDEKRYFVYDIKENKTVTFGLDFLKPKRYSDETAKKFQFYNSDGWEERIFKTSGVRVVAEAYSKPLYHFGVYDVGAKKIGVVGDLDTEKLEFRLDVLDADTGSYVESIRLPFGDGLMQNISDSARGMTPTYIDIDKGYYLWNNAEGEDSIDYARITTFKIKPGTKGK